MAIGSSDSVAHAGPGSRSGESARDQMSAAAGSSAAIHVIGSGTHSNRIPKDSTRSASRK